MGLYPRIQFYVHGLGAPYPQPEAYLSRPPVGGRGLAKHVVHHRPLELPHLPRVPANRLRLGYVVVLLGSVLGPKQPRGAAVLIPHWALVELQEDLQDAATDLGAAYALRSDDVWRHELNYETASAKLARALALLGAK